MIKITYGVELIVPSGYNLHNTAMMWMQETDAVTGVVMLLDGDVQISAVCKLFGCTALGELAKFDLLEFAGSVGVNSSEPLVS